MKAEYIDHMGSDLTVVNAARVSMDKESKWQKPDGVSQEWWDHCCPSWEQAHKGCLSTADAKLIRDLARGYFNADESSIRAEALAFANGDGPLPAPPRHFTPFAHTAITLRMTAPVPIRTQCFKHKFGFVENEQSRRYIITAPELFTPAVLRSRPEGSIKQGSGDTHPRSGFWLDHYGIQCRRSIELYEEMVADGVCPEQARFVLPQGVEVQWWWTGSLAAYARFYKQRSDSHAQREVQDLAQMVGDIIRPLFPVSWAALTEVS